MGLGYGGRNFSNYRLWIDPDMKNKSYCLSEDDTFKKGFLVDPSLKISELVYVEAWGL